MINYETRYMSQWRKDACRQTGSVSVIPEAHMVTGDSLSPCIVHWSPQEKSINAIKIKCVSDKSYKIYTKTDPRIWNKAVSNFSDGELKGSTRTMSNKTQNITENKSIEKNRIKVRKLTAVTTSQLWLAYICNPTLGRLKQDLRPAESMEFQACLS